MLKILVGAWGFESQTPTVSIGGPTPRITRNRFLRAVKLNLRLEKSLSDRLNRITRKRGVTKSWQIYISQDARPAPAPVGRHAHPMRDSIDPFSFVYLTKSRSNHPADLEQRGYSYSSIHTCMCRASFCKPFAGERACPVSARFLFFSRP